MNYLMKNYKPIDISFDYGKGCYLYTDKKEKYLDALSGIGVCCIGHANNEITKVINDQAKKLIHVSNLFNIKNQQILANKLCKINIPPNKISKRNHIHKGILHKDHVIQKSTRKVNDE